MFALIQVKFCASNSLLFLVLLGIFIDFPVGAYVHRLGSNLKSILGWQLVTNNCNNDAGIEGKISILPILRRQRFSTIGSSLLSESEGDSKRNEGLRTAEWARARGMEPGFGGYWPGDPNATKHEVKFVSKKTGAEILKVQVPEDRYIFFYIEEQGIDIPIVNKQRMCRQGCCTVCTARVLKGKVEMDSPMGLLRELRKQGYILTCTTYPRSALVVELQDEDEMYIKQWGDYFEGGGVEWGGVLPDDD